MISVYCVSLGCAKNRIDTEMILASFPETARLVDSPEQADLILINTCAFIADAKKESIQTILELSRYKGKVAVVGCLAERYEDEIKKEMPEIDCLVPIKDYGELQDCLTELTGEKGFRKLDPLKRVLTTGELSPHIRRLRQLLLLLRDPLHPGEVQVAPLWRDHRGGPHPPR